MNLKQVQTTCPYCGAGCQISFTVDTDANKIIEAVPANGRTNAGTLCLKGHYGWDYLNDPQILTKRLRKPMIRKGGKKSPLVEVSWDEARCPKTYRDKGEIWSGCHYGYRLSPRSGK